jgi:hypothetical protein
VTCGRSADEKHRYSDHTYMVLTMQKLVHLGGDDSEDGDKGEDESNAMESSRRSIYSRL